MTGSKPCQCVVIRGDLRDKNVVTTTEFDVLKADVRRRMTLA